MKRIGLISNEAGTDYSLLIGGIGKIQDGSGISRAEQLDFPRSLVCDAYSMLHKVSM